METVIKGYRSSWHIHDPIPDSVAESVPELSKMIAHLLYVRGYDTPTLIQNFISGELDSYDPYLLPDMKPAIDRIKQAIDNGEKIAIYGDFDVDGLSSSAIMYEVFTAWQANLGSVIIPQRKEGHGLAEFRIRQLHDEGTDLIITVDCGTNAVKEIDYIKSLDMDVIVTDHHTITGELPDCLVVNPSREDSQYPFSHLSGSGVAYKMAQALLTDPSFLDDLVALGTIADVVPIRDENRTFVINGLERMRKGERPGISALLKASDIDTSRLSSSSVSFYLGPKINSANRLADPELPYRLLITRDWDEAKFISKELGKTNILRQELLDSNLSRLLEELGPVDQVLPKTQILVIKGDWPSGINGLLASKLSDYYGIPSICACINEWGQISASGRSTGKTSIINILDKCSHHFHKYGGHEGAGGFVAEKSKWKSIKSCLTKIAKSTVKSDDGPSIYIDAEINFDQVNPYSVIQMDQISPFGQDFPEPLFYSSGITLTNRTLMSGGKHLSATASDGNNSIRALFFFHDPHIEEFSEDTQFDLVFSINTNMWKGKPETSIKISDWRITPTI